MTIYDSLTNELTLKKWRRRMVFWGGAIATGAAAVLFAKGSDLAVQALSHMRAWLPWWPFFGASLGLAPSAWLTKRVFVGAGNRDLTLPPMAAAHVGRGASAVVCRKSLYRTLAQKFVVPVSPTKEPNQQSPSV